MKTWVKIETEAEYKEALARFEEIRKARKGSERYKEKLLLVDHISTYELAHWTLPDVTAEEMAKIRKEEDGYEGDG